MSKILFLSLLLVVSLSLKGANKLQVASLHPIATDWLQQIGGDKIDIFAVTQGGAGFDPHRFTPSSSQVRLLENSQLIFAMGKNLESYLVELQDSLREDQLVIEIGRTIPSQKVDADPVYVCCPSHAHGQIDPHWWHNVRYAERAVRVMVQALSEADSSNKDYYEKQGRVLAGELRKLHRWVKNQVSKIPLNQRVLVTAHAAFAYFCKEYGFEAHYVQGLDQEGEIPAKQLAETLRQLRSQKVQAVFPEYNSNPKMLTQIAKEVGSKFGKPLDASGILNSYQDMIKKNVNNIVDALTL